MSGPGEAGAIGDSPLELATSRTHWLRGATWLGGGSVLSLAASAIAGVLLARFLDPSRFGVYAAVTVATTLVGSLSVYGLDLHLVTVLGDTRSERRTYASVLRLAFAIAILLTIAGEAIVWLAFAGQERVPLMIDLGEVTFAPLILRQVLLQVRGEQRSIVVALMVNRLAWIIAVLLVVSTNPANALSWLMTARVATLCIQGGALSILARLPRRRSGRRSGHRRERYSRRLGTSWGILRASTPLALSSIFGTSYNRIDQLILTAIRGPLATGLYAGGVRLAEVPSTIPSIVQNVSLPTLMRVRRSGRTDDLSRALNDAVLLTILPGGLAVSLLAGLGKPLVVFVLGPRFAGAATIVIILAAADWARLPATAYTSLALAVGRRRVLATATGAGVAVNILVNITLIPFLGAPAAALASLLSYGITALIITGGALRGIGLSPLSYTLPMRLGAAAVLASLVGHIGIFNGLSWPSVLQLIPTAAIIICAYVLAVGLFLPPKETHRIASSAGRILSGHRDRVGRRILPA